MPYTQSCSLLSYRRKVCPVICRWDWLLLAALRSMYAGRKKDYDNKKFVSCKRPRDAALANTGAASATSNSTSQLHSTGGSSGRWNGQKRHSTIYRSSAAPYPTVHVYVRLPTLRRKAAIHDACLPGYDLYATKLRRSRRTRKHRRTDVGVDKFCRGCIGLMFYQWSFAKLHSFIAILRHWRFTSSVRW